MKQLSAGTTTHEGTAIYFRDLHIGNVWGHIFLYSFVILKTIFSKPLPQYIDEDWTIVNFYPQHIMLCLRRCCR